MTETSQLVYLDPYPALASGAPDGGKKAEIERILTAAQWASNQYNRRSRLLYNISRALENKNFLQAHKNLLLEIAMPVGYT
jgi:hypothetical protein